MYTLMQSSSKSSLSLDQTDTQQQMEDVSIFCTLPVLDPKAPLHIMPS